MSTTFPITLDSFTNPSGTDKLNGSPNPAILHSAQHANLNDSVAALETKLGVNFSSVNTTVDFSLQILQATVGQHPKGGYKEITGGLAFPTTITWYTDSGKTIKLLEKTITYGPGSKKLVTGLTYKLFDGTTSNTLKRTITDTITLSGPFEISRLRVVT
jgi:hypothetical protein